jgi:hypothetical protein
MRRLYSGTFQSVLRPSISNGELERQGPWKFFRNFATIGINVNVTIIFHQ